MKFFRLFSFFIGIFCSIHGQCQTHEIDSLEQLFRSTLNRQKRIDLLTQISYKWAYINIDSAKVYADEAYKEAVASDYVAGQIKAMQRKCYYYMHIGDNQTALELIKKSESLADKIENKELLTSAYMIHGDILTNISAYDMALKHYILALDLSDITKNHEKKNLCLNRIGILHSKTRNFEKSLEFYQKALESPVSSKNIDEELWLMNNIASIYAEQKKDKKALEIYQKILRENSKNKTLEITVMGNIASIYSSMKNTVSAIVYYDKALKLCEGTGDVFQKIKILLNKCNLLLGQKKYTTIENDLKNIFRISKESGWPDITAKSARLLSQLYEKQHYFKKSLLYLTDYVKYSEIEENKENAKKIAEIQLRYDLEKETLEVEAKSHRKSILLICILIVSSVSISYILTLLIHFRTRAAKVVLQQKNLELEQERLKLEHQNMTNKLELSNKEVVSNVMLLQKKNDLLNSVAEQLLQRTNLFTKPNREIIENFVKELQQSVDDLGWQSIEKPFNQVYESFYKNLDAINPNLTINDRRLCAYIKLKMRSKEIAQVVNATPRSVEIARYRLRKKLGITNPTISLSGFLERL